jgi:hypothetical protein
LSNSQRVVPIADRVLAFIAGTASVEALLGLSEADDRLSDIEAGHYLKICHHHRTFVMPRPEAEPGTRSNRVDAVVWIFEMSVCLS